jgi:hypothetical protein
MPTISIFFGIIVQMFWNEHKPPHFHCIYGEYEALIYYTNAGNDGGQDAPQGVESCFGLG